MKNIYTFELSNDNLGMTPVDNLFINEYMPRSRGDYVKVYLYGLKTARCGESKHIDNSVLAQLLNISETDVINAWKYWEEEGIISVKNESIHQSHITFFHIPSIMFNGDLVKKTLPDDAEGKKLAEMFQQIEKIYGSRIIPQEDMLSFKHWVTEDGFEPETIVFLVRYAFELINRKGQYFTPAQTLNYMTTIALGWHKAGVHTLSEAEAYVDQNRRINKAVYQVLKKLGLSRSPMEAEREMILSWYNEYHFDEAMINLALSRTRKPDINYVNGILKRWYNLHLTSVEAVLREEKTNPQFSRKSGDIQMTSEQLREYEAMISEDERWLMEQSENE